MEFSGHYKLPNKCLFWGSIKCMLLFECDFINHYNYKNKNTWSETISMFGDDKLWNINYHYCFVVDILVFIILHR